MGTAEVTADGLKKVVAEGVAEHDAAKSAAREAKKTAKTERKAAGKDEAARVAKLVATQVAAALKGSPANRVTGRPGGSTGSAVNLGKPTAIRLSNMVRAVGAGDWGGAKLERDFSQTVQELCLADDHEQGVSVAIPTTRSAFARVVSEGGFNFGQSGDKSAFRSWAARMSEAEDAVTAAAIIGDPRLIQAARDAAESTIGAGGALVPPEYLQQMYTLSLQTAVAFANLPGVSRIPVKSNMIVFPREAVMPASGAYAEAATVTATDPTFGQQTILIKKQMGLNRYSNEMLADASPEYEALLTKSFTRSVALRQDYEFIEGDGTGAHVLGLRHYPGMTAGYTPATNGDAWGQSYNASGPVMGGVEYPLQMLAAARAAGFEPNAWLSHPDVMTLGLARAKDANGRYLLESVGGVFGAPVAVPNIGALPTQITYQTPPWKAMLYGAPFFMTSQIPENETYGGTNTTTHVFTGDWNFACILERQALEMARADQIYFTTDQTAVRISTRSAIVLLAPGAFMCQLGVSASTTHIS